MQKNSKPQIKNMVFISQTNRIVRQRRKIEKDEDPKLIANKKLPLSYAQGKEKVFDVDMIEPKPFVKWAGGKRQIISQLLQCSPSRFDEYYEPLLGGGALFFKLSALGKIKHAYLNDNSKTLIDAYKTIKEKPHDLIAELKSGKYKNDKVTFYEIRKEQPTDLVKATARFIYLNKTAFNGLYRVNSKGEFNVPYGKYKNPKILDEKNILAVSKALQKVANVNLLYE